MHTTKFNWKIVSISDSAWTHGLNSSTHMALICNIATGTFFKPLLPLFCPAVSFNFAEARRYPIVLPITFIWNFRLNFSIDVVQRETTFRMLQSRTYVIRKSNNLQNVAVANLRGSKEQQPPECCSRKPTCIAVGNLRSSKERHIKLYRSHNLHGSYP